MQHDAARQCTMKHDRARQCTMKHENTGARHGSARTVWWRGVGGGESPGAGPRRERVGPRPSTARRGGLRRVGVHARGHTQVCVGACTGAITRTPCSGVVIGVGGSSGTRCRRPAHAVAATGLRIPRGTETRPCAPRADGGVAHARAAAQSSEHRAWTQGRGGVPTHTRAHTYPSTRFSQQHASPRHPTSPPPRKRSKHDRERSHPVVARTLLEEGQGSFTRPDHLVANGAHVPLQPQAAHDHTREGMPKQSSL
jgi:hypothetical protein